MNRIPGDAPPREQAMVPASAMSWKLQSVPIRPARPVAAPVAGLMSMAGDVAKVEAPRAPHSLSPDTTMPAAVHAARLASVTSAPKDTRASMCAPLPSSMYTSNAAPTEDPQLGELVCSAHAHACPSSRPITDGDPTMFDSRVASAPSAEMATMEIGPSDPLCWPSVPIIRAPSNPSIASVASPSMIGPEGIGAVIVPFASISTALPLPRVPPPGIWLSPNPTKSGSNESLVGAVEGVPTGALVGAGENVGDAVGADVGAPVGDVVDPVGNEVAIPQAARAVAPAITRAIRWIRIEWFLSCFGVCMRNQHLFVWVTRRKRSRSPPRQA